MFYQRRGSKYGAKRQVFGDRVYMSKKEAGYAQELDLLKKGKVIKEYIPQFRLRLEVNGYKICDYLVDFLVIMADDSEELHEVKGFETDIWRLKWKLTEALYGDKYKLVLIK